MKKKFTTTLEEDIIRDIKIQAIKENRSVAELLEKLISEYMKKESN